MQSPRHLTTGMIGIHVACHHQRPAPYFGYIRWYHLGRVRVILGPITDLWRQSRLARGRGCSLHLGKLGVILLLVEVRVLAGFTLLLVGTRPVFEVFSATQWSRAPCRTS